MSENLSAAQRYEAAFNEVIPMYVELKSLDGNIHRQLYGSATRPDDNVLLIRPSDQDFVCDVELSLRAVLPTRLDMQTFYAVATEAPVDAEQKKKVVQRVGRELLRRDISPTSEYFRGKEVTLGTKRI